MMFEHKLLFGRNKGTAGYLLFLAMALEKYGITGATITNGLGFWKGKTEPQTTLIVIDGIEAESKLRAIGEKYCEKFNQESVLYTQMPLTEVSYITSVANRSATPLQTFTK